jgi:purine-cytosine permease-like protein
VSSSQEASTLTDRLDRLYEFERAPVTPDKLHDGRYFAAMFSGEHIAGTEFVIGALFVQWGAGAKDLLLGLLIGNALAVLSWAFICAPIATRTRLTLYWYVRRIIGPGLTVVYNFINGILYCCLAAAMIGVSASAIGLAGSKMGMTFKHPELDDVLPNSVGWVVIVLLVLKQASANHRLAVHAEMW